MLDYLGSLNGYLAVFLTTLIPLLEVTVSVPLALLHYKFSFFNTIVITLLASTLVPVIVIPLLDKIIRQIRNIHPIARTFVDAFLESKLHQHAAKFDKWGGLALAIFVAIPGPLSGVWSASLLAYIFGIRFWPAVISISIGGLGAIVLVALAVVGGRELLG